MTVPAGALVASTASVAVTSVFSFAAQVTSDSPGIITITSAGATSAAVGALIWVVRAMLSGRLVPRNTEALDEKLMEITAIQAEVIRKLAATVDEGNRREDRFYVLIDSMRGHS